MHASEFDYHLPEALIAQHPPQQRSGGRLLCLGGSVDSGSSSGPSDGQGDGKLGHLQITDFPSQLREGDLLVMNDTRVYPARLNGRKATGGKVELLVENILSESTALCLCKTSKSPKQGTELYFDDGSSAVVMGREHDLFRIEFTLGVPVLEFLQQHGSLPLPPYIERQVNRDDLERYQTVFAARTGAVAAPTAGLHFDEELLSRCTSKGVEQEFVTLHVGAGTFQPVRNDDLESHVMHAERLSVTDDVCRKIQQTKQQGGRVVAIGTTVVRALETAASSGVLKPYEGDTRLFLKPGDPFNVVDGLFTNFHLPRSTLLMLVCAFGGKQRLLHAYDQAVKHEYRFFSYGDAMLIWPDCSSSRF